jgi:alpha-tubulin suppressor-like RCC1 family protein
VPLLGEPALYTLTGDTRDRGVASGQLGDALPAIRLGTNQTARAVTAGIVHTCVLVAPGGSVKCFGWGGNGNGQLGTGDSVDRGVASEQMGDGLRAVALGTNRSSTAVVAGGHHTCVVLDDSSLKCFGDNRDGQLGAGDKVNRGAGSAQMGDGLRAIALGTNRSATTVLSGGLFHSCVQLDDRSLKCFGRNEIGQIGLGDKGNRGDAPGQMHDALRAIPLGFNRTARAVAGAAFSTCALLDDATVKCFGFNGQGQLGQGDVAPRGGLAAGNVAVLKAVDFGPNRTVRAVAAGGFHVCALLDDGSLKCFGHNLAGQLGLGDRLTRGVAAGQMGSDLPAIML